MDSMPIAREVLPAIWPDRFFEVAKVYGVQLPVDADNQTSFCFQIQPRQNHSNVAPEALYSQVGCLYKRV